MINVPTDGTNNVPQFKGKDIAYIPAWAAVATQEVVNSKLLEEVPNPSKINTDEYLSTEQVAYLVSAIRASFLAKTLDKDVNAPAGIKNYQPVAINIKLTERISARHSNVGDRFNAKTTNAVTVLGKDFPVGSTVTGKVVEVVRPGINNKNQGYIKVKFLTLKNGDTVIDFPASLSEAQANTLKNPNIIARIVGAPLTGAARVVGVAGRTGAAGVEVCANGLEQYGDQLSNTLVNTCTLHPGAGLKSFGNSFVTVGKGIYNLGKLAVSGTFGVIYEVGDDNNHLLVVALNKIAKKGYKSLDDVKSTLVFEATDNKKAEILLDEFAGAESLTGIKGIKFDTLKYVTFASPAYVSSTYSSERLVGAAISNLQNGASSAPVKGDGGVWVAKKLSEDTYSAGYDDATEKVRYQSNAGYITNMILW